MITGITFFILAFAIGNLYAIIKKIEDNLSRNFDMNKRLSDIQIKETRENFYYKEIFYYLLKVLKEKDANIEKEILSLVEQNSIYIISKEYKNEVNRLFDKEIERS